ncbi:hypothetical protein N1851_014551 [Merluccius polli]|uniref:MULE transposase domain-containing protein n=1 Tax=Merluccius polli TaxID=89951 RepID=A0AA47P0R9_MERPO|nr:hypothetical protein N1851_033572 [Merluccius polli]KAK0146151.1 hypothetical protein N1851_014551 [Merluccius polli]
MCFMDASGNMDRHHCQVFLLLTHSCAGGLPLGIIITQSEEGLKRAALSRAFPQAKLLCSFHLLQAVWRWLWCKENDFSMSDRTTLFAVVKDLLYAREESSLHSHYHQALESSAFNRLVSEVQGLCGEALQPEGVLGSLLQGHHACKKKQHQQLHRVRILKDKILHRTKAYKVPQLFDFLTTRLSAYYEARITDTAIGHWEGLQKSRFLVKDNSVKPEDIHKVKLYKAALDSTVNVNKFPWQGWRLKETFQ